MAFHYENEKQDHKLIEKLTFEGCKLATQKAILVTR